VILAVTGTSTGVGKTVACAALAAAVASDGRPVTVVKPAQTGFPDGAERDFADNLSDAATVSALAGVPTVEGRRYPDPLAPLTAARRAGRPPLRLDEAVRLCVGRHGLTLVEGAGGVLVRLGVGTDGTDFTLLDLAAELGAAVLVVADPALGTLNHTELTTRAIAAAGLCCAGVVLSRWPERPGLAERCNVEDLPRLTGVPIVGRIPDGAQALPSAEFTDTAATWFRPEFLAEFE
jgi:dethiobiotin synthetase